MKAKVLGWRTFKDSSGARLITELFDSCHSEFTFSPDIIFQVLNESFKLEELLLWNSSMKKNKALHSTEKKQITFDPIVSEYNEYMRKL